MSFLTPEQQTAVNGLLISRATSALDPKEVDALREATASRVIRTENYDRLVRLIASARNVATTTEVMDRSSRQKLEENATIAATYLHPASR